MAIESKEEALAFVEANRLMFEDKTGFKHFASKLRELEKFINTLAEEAPALGKLENSLPATQNMQVAPSGESLATPYTDNFIADNKRLEFLKSTMMGPNALRLTEELTSHLEITKHMNVLDLGCGQGLSALLLAEKYGAVVVAADLWIDPSDNYARFCEYGIEDRAFPLSVDVTKGLPFARQYFDILLSVDAYQYFGTSADALCSLCSFVKKDGYIAVVIPGLKHEFGEKVPTEIKPFWNEEMARSLHSLSWWEALWSQEKSVELITCSEMASHKLAWDEWLTGNHPVVAGDIKMMKAEGGHYFNTIQLIARVR